MHKDGVKVARILKSINKTLHKGMGKRFNNYGFTVPQLIVIGTVFDNKRMKISELSKTMQLSNSTISAMINGLEKKNVIKRIKSSEDRRVTYIELDENYKKIAEELHSGIERYLENILEKAQKEEVKNIINGLENLQRLLED